MWWWGNKKGMSSQNAKITPKGNSDLPTSIFVSICVCVCVSANIVFVIRDHKNEEQQQNRWTFWAERNVYAYCVLNGCTLVHMYLANERFLTNTRRKNLDITKMKGEIERLGGMRCCLAIRCNIYKIAHFKFSISFHSRFLSLSCLLSIARCRFNQTVWLSFVLFVLKTNKIVQPNSQCIPSRMDSPCAFVCFDLFYVQLYESFEVYWYDFVCDGDDDGDGKHAQSIQTNNEFFFFSSCLVQVKGNLTHFHPDVRWIHKSMLISFST